MVTHEHLIHNAGKVKERLLTQYIWVVYTLTVVILGALLLVAIVYARAQIRQAAQAQTHSLALAMDEINRRQLESMAFPLEFVAHRIQERGGFEKLTTADLDPIFHSAQNTFRSTQIRAFLAIDKDGVVLASTAPQVREQLKKPLKDTEEFNYLKTQKNYTVLTSAISPVDQKRVLILNKTLRNKDGLFEGFIAVSRALEDFEAFYETLDMPQGVSFTVFRDDGRVIYRFPDNNTYQSRQVAFPERIGFQSEGAIEGKGILDGADKIGYYKFSAPFGVMTYVGYSKDIVFSGWNIITASISGIFLVFIGFLFVMVRLVEKRQMSLRQTLLEEHHREDLIRQIQIKTEVFTGQDFLRELGLQISKYFKVKNVAIGVLMPEHANSVKFVVNWVGGTLGTDYIYDLRGTPFENIQPGEFFVYPSSAHKMFPQDPLLSYRNVESCMGLILQDSEQKPIGILMIYSDQEMQDVALKRTVLSVFAARAGAELERIHADEIRKEVERLRRQIEERSLQSEKMEAIGTLAEGIAHDFNNILAIIMATTEKMFGMHRDSPQDLHYLEAIKKACHRARHLVAQILVFSRKEDSSIQPIEIKSIFDETMDFLRATLPAQIRLTLDLADCGELRINADLSQIQQALMNLCVNAARALGINGGEIRLSLRRTQVKEHSYVKLSLHYNGEELGRDEIEKIFDPFYAQNIGMVVVQRIVTNHQGFIEVKSSSAQGTDFEVFLPVVTSTSVEEEAVTPYNFKSSQRVMIVDDEPEIGFLIKELLETEGLHVDAFSNPIEALKTFTELQTQYFLIISDLSMPGMSGMEFARKVREMNKKIPLVLWSGYHQFLDDELQNLNVKLLSKPVDVQKLLTLISVELSQKSAQDASKEGRGPDSAPVERT